MHCSCHVVWKVHTELTQTMLQPALKLSTFSCPKIQRMSWKVQRKMTTIVHFNVWKLVDKYNLLTMLLAIGNYVQHILILLTLIYDVRLGKYCPVNTNITYMSIIVIHIFNKCFSRLVCFDKYYYFYFILCHRVVANESVVSKRLGKWITMYKTKYHSQPKAPHRTPHTVLHEVLLCMKVSQLCLLEPLSNNVMQ